MSATDIVLLSPSFRENQRECIIAEVFEIQVNGEDHAGEIKILERKHPEWNIINSMPN
jgi:hypothetical protein